VAERRLELEVMDDPGLASERLLGALRGLERINWWSGSTRIVWSAIRPLLHERRTSAVRLLDIATGAGDVPIGLARRARRAGLKLEVAGCDVNPRAVSYAQQRAATGGVEARFFPLDAVRDELPSGYDVLTCSLFLHHLDHDAARALLARMGQVAARLVAVNDLARNRAGLLVAHLGSRVFSACDVVRSDAGRSVRAAFTRDEVRKLAEEAGLHGAVVRRRWPRRYLLTWRK
jgi:2-polyprenyl-3-methyl-5-hydroxy-6-metoxy-1,4-benzoquinol methylase